MAFYAVNSANRSDSSEFLTLLRITRPPRIEILRSYRFLLKKCSTLMFTDKQYYRVFIRKDIKQIKWCKTSEDLDFEVRVIALFVILLAHQRALQKLPFYLVYIIYIFHHLYIHLT
ncbi:hypothetical protein MXB_1418 [Myxobolus squamalis]|nr:hypothetical protein MXB_1418 [Myxobolus squamalis]